MQRRGWRPAQSRLARACWQVRKRALVRTVQSVCPTDGRHILQDHHLAGLL